MKSFPQPCVAPSESARLEAEQGHAKSAKASMQERFSKFSFLKFHIPHFAFPNEISPSRLYPDSVGAWRPLRESSAFSLTEVVIAMGVAAVAFTSIIALFPLGLNMSKESYEATQAALIAQTIFCDLRDQLTGSTPLKGRLVQIKEVNSPLDLTSYQNVNTTLTRDTPKSYMSHMPKNRTVLTKLAAGPLFGPVTQSPKLSIKMGCKGRFSSQKYQFPPLFAWTAPVVAIPNALTLQSKRPDLFPHKSEPSFFFQEVLPNELFFPALPSSFCVAKIKSETSSC